MPKSSILDARTKKGLNELCKRHGYNFPLGDWIEKIDALAEKLDADAGVSDTDYDDTIGNDGQ